LDALPVPIPAFVKCDRSPEVGEGWLQLKQLGHTKEQEKDRDRFPGTGFK
jgi:hypothetical protein